MSNPALDEYAKQKEDRAHQLSEIFRSAHAWDAMAISTANSAPRNRLQESSVPLLAASYSILFSIETLVSRHHLFAAELLCRPLLERVGLLYYFLQHEDGVGRWERGWEQSEPGRPSITNLVECIPAFKRPESERYRKALIKRLHAVVHADPIGHLRMLQEDGDGDVRIISGPMPQNSQRYLEIANDIIISAIALLNVTQDIFPEARWSELGRVVSLGVRNA